MVFPVCGLKGLVFRWLLGFWVFMVGSVIELVGLDIGWSGWLVGWLAGSMIG